MGMKGMHSGAGMSRRLEAPIIIIAKSSDNPFENKFK